MRAFQKACTVKIIEPRLLEGFVSTGGARPAQIPESGVQEALRDFEPDFVACLGGGLFLTRPSRQLFAKRTVFAGFAMSDPLGLEASLEIAPEFDLFYTQDPQTLEIYKSRGIQIRRCDPAIDPELYRPLGLTAESDILFYGKWTPYRDEVLRLLASRFCVRLHAHLGEQRWSLPVQAPLEVPSALCEALNRTRLALEVTVLDDVQGQFRGRSRLTNRPQFAAACGIPSLIDHFDRLSEFFEPGEEIVSFRSLNEILERTAEILSDDSKRQRMAGRARARVLREQTWDLRVASVLQDREKLRS